MKTYKVILIATLPLRAEIEIEATDEADVMTRVQARCRAGLELPFKPSGPPSVVGVVPVPSEGTIIKPFGIAK